MRVVIPLFQGKLTDDVYVSIHLISKYQIYYNLTVTFYWSHRFPILYNGALIKR